MSISKNSLLGVRELFIFLLLPFQSNSSRMQVQPIEPGDKLTFQWRPGYRGPLRDGETVIVLAVVEEGVQIKYRLNQKEIVRPDHLLR